MIVCGYDGSGHDGWREGGTEDEVDHGAAVLSMLCSVGFASGDECLHRAGDRVVDDFCGIGVKDVGKPGMPVEMWGSCFGGHVCCS